MSRRLDAILYRRINTVVAAVVAVTLVLVLSMALVAILFAAHMRSQREAYEARLDELAERVGELRDDVTALQQMLERGQYTPQPAAGPAPATREVGPAIAESRPASGPAESAVLLSAQEVERLARWLAAAQAATATPDADAAAGLLMDKAIVRLAKLDAEGARFDRDMLVLLAKANLIRGDAVAATVLLRRALNDEPAAADLHALLAAAYLKANQKPQAIAEFRDAIRLDGTLADARLTLAALLLEAGQTDEAKQTLAGAAEARLDAAQQRRLAELWTAAGEDGRAAALLEKLAAAAPATGPAAASAWRALGEATLRTKDYPKAADAFSKAAEAGENSAEVQYNWGLALLAQQKRDEAEVHMARATELQPAWADAWWAYGAVLAQQGKNEAAVTAFQNCITADAEHPRAWLNLAMSLVAIGKIREAIAGLEEDLRSHPDSANGHLLLARLYAQQNRPRDVAVELEAALRLNPELRKEAAASPVFSEMADPDVRRLLNLPAATSQPASRPAGP